MGVRQLQALVRPVTDHPAEPAFLVVTQVMELWFTLLRREWELAQRQLRADDLDGAVARSGARCTTCARWTPAGGRCCG